MTMMILVLLVNVLGMSTVVEKYIDMTTTVMEVVMMIAIMRRKDDDDDDDPVVVQRHVPVLRGIEHRYSQQLQ